MQKGRKQLLTSILQGEIFFVKVMQAVPVMMAGSIQLAVPSQLRLCEMPPGWFTLEEEEDDEDEDEEELGSPPKLMLMLGKSALSPSCHSFTFRLSTEVLFSVREGAGGVSKRPCAQMHQKRRDWGTTGEMKRRWRKKKQLSVSTCTTQKQVLLVVLFGDSF